MFHISQLKRQHGNHTVPILDLPSTLNMTDKEPAALLGRRIIKKDNKAAPQLLIHWKYQTPENATWEDYYSFVQAYPTFDLGDKVSSEGGRSCNGE